MGDRLDLLPVLWTTWGRWKDKHPDTSVLTTDTGYIRSYVNDPYGSYLLPAGRAALRGIDSPLNGETDLAQPTIRDYPDVEIAG